MERVMQRGWKGKPGSMTKTRIVRTGRILALDRLGSDEMTGGWNVCRGEQAMMHMVHVVPVSGGVRICGQI
jgi:hypothetical protein